MSTEAISWLHIMFLASSTTLLGVDSVFPSREPYLASMLEIPARAFSSPLAPRARSDSALVATLTS